MKAQELPLDLLQPILEHLTDRKDWLACSLVNKAFNQTATPLLYHTLDSRLISKVNGLSNIKLSYGLPSWYLVAVVSPRHYAEKST